MMNEFKDKIKYIVFTLLIIINFVVLFSIYFKNKESEVYLKEIQIKQKQIDSNITRSSSSVVSKEDLDKIIKDSKIDLSKIEKDLENLNGKIESINKVQVVTVYQKETDKSSDFVKPKNPEEKVEVKPDDLKLETQFLELKEKFNNGYVPIGNVGFSFWKKNPWEFEILQRKYNVTNIIAKTDKNETIVYNKFSINVNNKDYDLIVNNSETIYSFPENKFHFYPKLFISSGVGYKFNHSVHGSIYLLGSFIQYGQFKNNPKFSLLSVGIGKELTSNEVKFTIVPIMYNLSNFTKLIQNSYIGAGFSMDTNKISDVSVNLSLSF